MNVYKLNADGSGNWVWFWAAERVVLPDYSNSRTFFDRHPRIRLVRDPESQGSKLPDYSNVNTTPYPCFSGHAKAVLGPYLEGLGQWLELDCAEGSYWLFNITNIVDALDEPASRIVDLGSVVAVKEFAFKPEALRNQLIFKIPQRPGSYNLVTDAFVKLVEEHKLTGFKFTPLWSDETQPNIAAM